MEEEQLTQEEIKKVKDLVEDYTIPIRLIRGEGTKSLQSLAFKICQYYHITLNAFLSHRRECRLVNARKDFIHMAKRDTQRNYSDIARFLNRDHSTILYHIERPPVNLDKIDE